MFSLRNKKKLFLSYPRYPLLSGSNSRTIIVTGPTTGTLSMVATPFTKTDKLTIN